MKFSKKMASKTPSFKYALSLLSACALLLSTSMAHAAIGYKDGFNKAILMGHSFFRPGTEDLEVLAPHTGYTRHNQYVQTAGGSNGDPGSLWRDIGENSGAKAEIKLGGVELLGLTVFSELDGDSDYEDYVTWIDFTLQYNPDSLDTVAIMIAWDSYVLYPNYDDYRARIIEANQLVHTLISHLRTAYPDLTIIAIPVAEAMVRLWEKFDNGELGPEVEGVWKDGDRDYMQHDNRGHAGYVLEDAIGLIWQQTIYPETNILNVANPPTYQKTWTYDLRELARKVWEDDTFAKRYNDGPIDDTAPEFTSNPVVESNATAGLSYTGSTLADNASDDNGDALSFAKVSGPNWLSVAANGGLSGTPSTSNLGQNSFVVSVSDGQFAPVEGTLQINVVESDITSISLEDPSFENVQRVDGINRWAQLSAAWNDAGNGNYEVSNYAISTPADGEWAARLKTIDPIYQDLGVTVNEGETLEVTYYGGRAREGLGASGGGVGESTFIVGSTRYSATFDTTILPADSMQQYTHSVTVTNSGVVRLGFRAVSDDPFLDAVSDVQIVGGSSNTAPVFTSSTITLSDGIADQAYSDSIAGSATDADNDPLTYTRVSGASWVNVSANGSVTGTPNAGFIGSNNVTVMVDDGNGGTDTATLSIFISDAPTKSTLIDEGFEVFDFTEWDTDWIRVTGKKYSGDASLKGNSARNDLISPEVDASALSTITLTFKYYKQNVDLDDNLVLQLWNGNSYTNIADLAEGANRTWLEYSRTINVAQTPNFFINDLKFKIEGSSLDYGEAIWVDDVLVTGE